MNDACAKLGKCEVHQLTKPFGGIEEESPALVRGRFAKPLLTRNAGIASTGPFLEIWLQGCEIGD